MSFPRLIDLLTVFAIVLWSLLNLLAWAVLGLGGDLLHAQLDWLFLGDPDIVPAASWVVRILQSFGIWVIALAWAGGAILIWLTSRIFRRVAATLSSAVFEPVTNEAAGFPDERYMKDVTPRAPATPRALPRD